MIQIAKTVYTTEEVALQDDTTVVLKPLNIKGLRKFMDKMGEFAQLKEGDDGMDILIDAASIALMKQRPEFWDEKKNEGKGGASDEAEDVFDMPTVYRILSVCGGVDLNDPNLIAAATEALGKS